MEGDSELLDLYAQKASDDASEINMDLADEVYESAIEGEKRLNEIYEVLLSIYRKLELERKVNSDIDNTR